MDFLKKFTEATNLGGDTKETPTPTTTATVAAASDNPPSQTELYASAQVVAEAAKAAINRDPANVVDNYKLAGATADILDAAEHYGKLDTTTGIGSYFEKAEGYLKKYESSNSIPPPKSPEETEEPKSTTRSPPPPAEEITEKKEEVIEEEKTAPPPPAPETATPPPPAAETAAPPPPAAETEKSEGEIGDYVKKAEGLLEKKEGGDSGSGLGGAFKAAGDFWKKN